MDGVPILITDFNEGICLTLLEVLSRKKALLFVLVKDFETIHELYANFTSIIPIVLNAELNVESASDHLSVLPAMSCIFNFEGEEFENMFRQTFDHFIRSINVYKEDFDMGQVSKDILEAISDSYTLIINLVDFPQPAATDQLLVKVDEAPPSNHHIIFFLEKMFHRPPRKAICPAQAKEKAAASSSIARDRGVNPISIILKRIFIRFTPCVGMSVMMSRRSVQRVSIKSPAEINKYIRMQQSFEIKSVFETIHEAAIRNWISQCKETFDFSLAYEQQFQRLCGDIHVRGEEGRQALMDKINKDLEDTKQWNHVLGEKTLAKLKLSREHEVDLKVQQYCVRKIAEAREKTDEDIQQNKIRVKCTFYNDILDEQVMELIRIQQKFEKRSELLMLPHTGDLRAFAKE